MRSSLIIAGKELRRRLRDRSGLVLAFVAPAVLATILSSALNFSAYPGFDLGVVDADGAGVGDGVVQALRAPELRGAFAVLSFDQSEDAQRALRRGWVDAVIVVPSGFTEALRSGREASLEIVRDPDKGIAGDVAAGIAQGAAARVSTVRLAVATALAQGAEGDAAALAAEAAAQGSLIGIADAGVTGPDQGTATYYGPAMAVFFLFFTVGVGVRALTTERREGTLRRLLAAPLRPATVPLGIGLAAFVTGLVAMTTIALFSTVVLGGTWGDPVAVGAVIVAVVLAGMGLTALITALARTDQQAEGMTSAMAVVFGLLGGTFVPLSQAPEALERLRLVTPHGWALDGFFIAAFDGGGVGDVVQPVTALVAIGVVTGALAVAAGRRLLRAV